MHGRILGVQNREGWVARIWIILTWGWKLDTIFIFNQNFSCSKHNLELEAVMSKIRKLCFFPLEFSRGPWTQYVVQMLSWLGTCLFKIFIPHLVSSRLFNKEKKMQGLNHNHLATRLTPKQAYLFTFITSHYLHI